MSGASFMYTLDYVAKVLDIMWFKVETNDERVVIRKKTLTGYLQKTIVVTKDDEKFRIACFVDDTECIVRFCEVGSTAAKIACDMHSMEVGNATVLFLNDFEDKKIGEMRFNSKLDDSPLCYLYSERISIDTLEDAVAIITPRIGEDITDVITDAATYSRLREMLPENAGNWVNRIDIYTMKVQDN